MLHDENDSVSVSISIISQWNNIRKCAYLTSPADDKRVEINALILPFSFSNRSENVLNSTQSNYHTYSKSQREDKSVEICDVILKVLKM